MPIAIVSISAPLPHLPHPPSLTYTISSLSACASGVYSIKLVDLLLAAHPQVTQREVDFTILILDAVVHMNNHPYAPTPTRFLKKAVNVPDLIHALASSPDFKSIVTSDEPLDLRLVFECLVRRIMFQYCYRELGITPDSYQQAIEYLTDRAPELATKHKQYRAGIAQLEQQEKKVAGVVEVGKRKRMARSASSIALSMFKSKKRLVAK
ncbi:hypothetical protein FS749_009394 [Ceratobasidium sp. UAMH 11750]|nr:hypothetical protein FS749_009394 [Ceratobasidium sp. UAMH 11750]